MTDPRSERFDGMVDVSGLVYGVHLQGRLPAEFQLYLQSPEREEAVRGRTIGMSYRALGSLPDVDEIWAAEPSPQTNDRLALFRQEGGFGLKVAGDGKGLFRLTPRAIDIEWSPQGARAAGYFFSHALPLWLESRGVPVLHASAVSFENRAVAFIGRSGIGKSTLCAELVRSGCRFVADDGVPLREDDDGTWRCFPGPPFLRLWPSALEGRLGMSAEALPRIRESLEKRLMPSPDGSAVSESSGLALATVYVLDRLDESAPISISGCSARESLVFLLEHSLAASPAAALGLSAQRLEQLSRVVADTRVKTLRYPTDGDGWRPIREAILEDLAVEEAPL